MTYVRDGTGDMVDVREALFGLPKPKQPRPDSAYVTGRKEQLLRLWSAAHGHWDEVDEYVNGANPLWSQMPPQVRAVRDLGVKRSGKARKLVDTVVSQFLVAEAKVHREPVGKGEGHRDKASEVEDFGAAWLKDLDNRSLEPVMQAVKKHLALYNYAVLEGVLLEPGTAERLPAEVEEGAAKRRFNPTAVLSPHPKTVLMDPRRPYPREAIKLLRMTRGELAEIAQAHGKEYSAGEAPYEEVTALEYWSEDWRQLYPEETGEAVIDERNVFQSVPFVQRFGPGGMVTGNVQDAGWLRYKCVGILEPVLDLLTEYDETISALDHYLQKAAYLKTITRKDAADAAEELEGNVLQGEVDDWGYLETPNLPQTLFQIVERCERDIEKGTFPELIGGFRPEGVTTASQNSQLNVAASRQFQPYLTVMEDMTGAILQRLFRLVITWGRSVTVNGLTIGPNDLEGDDNAQVSYPYVDPVLELEKRNEAKESYKLGLMDKDTYWETIGVENPGKIRKGLIRDRNWEHPGVLERASRIVAEEDGLAEIIADYERRMRTQNGLVDPRGNPIASQPPQGGGAPGLLRQPIDEKTAMPPAPGMSVPAQMSGR